MRNRIGTIGFSLALCLSTAPALAQDIGEEGTFVLSADRLFGFVHTSTNAEADEALSPEIETTTDNFGLLLHGGAASPFSFPRASFDYFLTDGLSLGGVLGYWSSSTERDGDLGTGEASTSVFLLSPRVGYAIMFSDSVGFWPRGGFSFYTGDSEGGAFGIGGDVSFSGFGLNLDAPFVFVPAEHLAILAGPALDFGFGGAESDPGNVDWDTSIVEIGIHVGLAATF